MSLPRRTLELAAKGSECAGNAPRYGQERIGEKNVNPYKVVKDFEQALCDYTGAKYAVTTTSCTMALLLACAWCKQHEGAWRKIAHTPFITPTGTITIPRYTYVGVPMSIMHAGFEVAFEDYDWEKHGMYRLKPLRVIDSARLFTMDMFASSTMKGEFICVSFHPTKTLGISTHGGAILHNNDEADEWLRMARFDGRREGVSPRDQKDWIMGFHAYMNPVTAAEGLMRLATLPEGNPPLPWDDYPDLSKLEIFK
jgi:dTDP-4-amino-4,6-dideoxygalactose transaminase